MARGKIRIRFNDERKKRTKKEQTAAPASSERNKLQKNGLKGKRCEGIKKAPAGGPWQDMDGSV